MVDGKKEKKFQFDHVLSPDSTNEEVGSKTILIMADDELKMNS